MIEMLLYAAITLYGVAILIALYRIAAGPSLPDRVFALDIVNVNLISGIAIISILLDTKAFLDVILILGILAFIGTISFSKFIERGVIIERKRND